MTGLGPVIHEKRHNIGSWMAGPNPAMNDEGGAHRRYTLFRAISWRAMMMRCNSLVPSPITRSGASR
jgi:hypothetical protein